MGRRRGAGARWASGGGGCGGRCRGWRGVLGPQRRADPRRGGTKISLVNELATSPAPAFRLRLGERIARRHLVTALYAPLHVNARGSVDRDVVFAGGSYPAGSPLLAVYRFDSYRLTYRYSYSIVGIVYRI